MDLINTTLLKRLIRALEGIERRPTCPLQQQKDHTGPNTTPNQEQAQPISVVTIRAITELGNADAMQHKAEQKRTETLQKKSVRVQWVLCGLTALAFGAAAWYAHIAAQQRDTMDRTLVSTQRAYLSVGKPRDRKGRSLIYIPIENYGHVSSANPKFTFRYTRINSSSETYAPFDIRIFGYNAEAIVAPGPAGYTAIISPPTLPPSALERVYSGKETEMISGIVTYDTGFNYTDRFGFCFNYTAVQEEWESCGATTTFIDLNASKPDHGK